MHHLPACGTFAQGYITKLAARMRALQVLSNCAWTFSGIRGKAVDVTFCHANVTCPLVRPLEVTPFVKCCRARWKYFLDIAFITCLLPSWFLARGGSRSGRRSTWIGLSAQKKISGNFSKELLVSHTCMEKQVEDKSICDSNIHDSPKEPPVPPFWKEIHLAWRSFVKLHAVI